MGFAFLWVRAGHWGLCAELMELAVVREEGGSGAGRALLSAAEALCRRRGIRRRASLVYRGTAGRFHPARVRSVPPGL